MRCNVARVRKVNKPECFDMCEHGECKGKRNYPYCQFCQLLCIKCDKKRFHEFLNTLRSYLL